MSKKVRILYVLSEFMYGSKVRQVCDLVRGLDHNTFDIEIAGYNVGDEARQEIQSLGVPNFALRLIPPRRMRWGDIRKFLRSPLILRTKNYDLVHSLCYQSIFTEPLLFKAITQARYIYTKTNMEWLNHRINWNLKSRLADCIISISRATDKLLADQGFADKTRRIYLGLDTEVFNYYPNKGNLFREKCSISKETFVFGCAAQFVESKEHLTLIAAFERLCEAHPDTRLLLCGTSHGDNFYDRITKRVRESPFHERIHLLGTLTDMPSFYSSIDCFVLPSRIETFGYVYIEAMSCQRPVIGCRSGGPEDIIDDGQNGYFAEMSSPGDLAQKMTIYLRDPQSGYEHGAAGRKKVQEVFSKTAMIENHKKLYLDFFGL